jgi:hypothetical protein
VPKKLGSSWEAELLGAFTKQLDVGDLARLVLPTLSPQQRAFHRDKRRYRVWLGGRRSGKTYGQAVHMLLASIPGETTPYIAPRIGDGRAILWPQLEILDHKFKLGLRFNRQHHTVTTRQGAVIKIYGLNTTAEAEKLRGRRYPMAFIDEAGAINQRVLEYAIRECLAPATKDFTGIGGRGLVIAGTPSKLVETWWHKETRRARENGCLYFTTIKDNPFFKGREEQVIREYCEDYGLAITSPAVRREWFGEFVVDSEALCYPWDQSITPEAELPKTGLTILAVDLGYRHPCAFVVLRVFNGHAYVLKAYEEAGMTVDDVARTIREYQQRYGIGHMCGDSEGAQLLASLRDNYGIPIIGTKGAGRKLDRIWGLASRLRSKTLHLGPDTEPLQDEFNSVGFNDERDDHHEKQADHCLDAIQYGLDFASAIQHPEKPTGPVKGSPEWWAQEQAKMRKMVEAQNQTTGRRGLA